jgi:hypothetical protein
MIKKRLEDTIVTLQETIRTLSVRSDSEDGRDSPASKAKDSIDRLG